MRLYPPNFGVTHPFTAADTCRGRRIPANASLTLVCYNKHRNPRFWAEPNLSITPRTRHDLPMRAYRRP